MAKYSEEFKLQVVQDYLNSSMGYSLITKKYGLSNKSLVRQWVRSYKEFGMEGLVKKTKK